MQSNKLKSSNHYVFISDNDGMNTVFPLMLNLLKREQAPNDHISLLYFSDNGSYIFQEEVNILTVRFPASLIVYFKNKPQREFLETILNTNTKKHIEFILSVNEEWQYTIMEDLAFLGVHSMDIHLTSLNLYHKQ